MIKKGTTTKIKPKNFEKTMKNARNRISIVFTFRENFSFNNDVINVWPLNSNREL